MLNLTIAARRDNSRAPGYHQVPGWRRLHHRVRGSQAGSRRPLRPSRSAARTSRRFTRSKTSKSGNATTHRALWENFLEHVHMADKRRETFSTPELGAAAFSTVNMGVQSYRFGKAACSGTRRKAKRPEGSRRELGIAVGGAQQEAAASRTSDQGLDPARTRAAPSTPRRPTRSSKAHGSTARTLLPWERDRFGERGWGAGGAPCWSLPFHPPSSSNQGLLRATATGGLRRPRSPLSSSVHNGNQGAYAPARSLSL